MSNIAPTDAPVTEPGDAAEPSGAPVQYRVGDPAPPPLKPFTEPELIAMWGGKTEPVVSILCPTYNHREFIADALDGFLGQATDFPFEVIVRDDASTDGTADIVRSYAERYPKVIRAILEPQNTFSQGISFIPPLAKAARGSLIALCAGDDYWITRNRLEIQAGILLNCPEISLCIADGVSVKDSTIAGTSLFRSNTRQTDRNEISEWTVNSTPLPVTWVFRRRAAELFAPELNHLLNEDTFILRQLQASGQILAVNRPSTVYRLHATALWSTLSDRTRHAQLLNTDLHISGYFFRTRKARLGRANALAAARRALVEIERYHPSARRWLLFYSLLLAAKRLWWWRRKGS